MTVTVTPSAGKSTSPSSHTTVCAVATGHVPRFGVAVTPSRPTVVVNVIRTPRTVPVPVPDTVTLWVTRVPGGAANGVEVSTGTRSTGDGPCAGIHAVNTVRTATTDLAPGSIRTPYRASRRSC